MMLVLDRDRFLEVLFNSVRFRMTLNPDRKFRDDLKSFRLLTVFMDDRDRVRDLLRVRFKARDPLDPLYK